MNHLQALQSELRAVMAEFEDEGFVVDWVSDRIVEIYNKGLAAGRHSGETEACDQVPTSATASPPANLPV